ncbi:GlpM family protein [Salmonella enterica subsp. enterica serovar Enteritidis str. 76-2651]|nr:GlpM family protein [Salmonella enterica subsp. enterica serovar Enteritidis str. 76-2651]
MGLVIKAALGALVVVLIGLLSKTKNYYIAGLIPLFPTFALIAHYIVASDGASTRCVPPSSLACGRSFLISFILQRYGISAA